MIHIVIVSGFTLAVSGILVAWLLVNPVRSFTASVPGMDNRKAGNVSVNEQIRIGENFVFSKEAEEIPGILWNRFRGPDFDNISKESIPLVDTWGAKGPKILWKKDLGEGHAAPAIYNGKVYILDYEESTKSDVLRCLSLLTGEELWNRNYKVHLKRNHGLSRTIPAVSDKFVVSIGPRGHVMCVDRLTGTLLWGLDLEKEYGAEIPFWYTGQCPLLQNDTAVIAIGGKSLMVGINSKTGKIIWETPNPKGWKMSHSSVMPMKLNGKDMFIYCGIGGISGISASGADVGKVLWETSGFSPSVIAPSPLILGEGKILVMAGYGAGSVVLHVRNNDGNYSVEITDKFKPSQGISSEQQTPVLYHGHVYAVMPKDAGEMRNQFACYKPSDLKKAVMSSGKTNRFGLGPYMVADGKFFILNDDGELTIARATPSEFRILGKTRIIDGQDSWGPLAISGGYLLMRDSKQMVCIDLKK